MTCDSMHMVICKCNNVTVPVRQCQCECDSTSVILLEQDSAKVIMCKSQSNSS